MAQGFIPDSPELDVCCQLDPAIQVIYIHRGCPAKYHKIWDRWLEHNSTSIDDFSVVTFVSTSCVHYILHLSNLYYHESQAINWYHCCLYAIVILNCMVIGTTHFFVSFHYFAL